MKRNDWIFLLTVALYSFLFWKQYAGLNMLLFSCIIVFGTLFMDLSRLKKRGWWIAASGVLISGLGCYLNGSWLAIIGNLASLLLLATQCVHAGASVLVSGFVSTCSVIGSFVFMLMDSVERRKKSLDAIQENDKTTKKRVPGRIWAILLSIGVLIVFFLIYRQSNLLFREVTKNINLDFISLGWIIFTAIGACVIYGIYYLHGPLEMAKDSAQRPRNLIPEEAGNKRWGDGLLSLENERFVGILLLALLNLLTLVVNSGDFLFHIGSTTLPKDFSMTSYVHQGVGGLILSILMAMAVVLFFFRGRLNFDERYPLLRSLALVWLLQNCIMLFFTGMRNNLYTLEYGLTYKRLGVYFYLLLTMAGLFITSIKVMKRKTNSWLFNVNTWAAYTVLVGSTLISWDRFITSYNMTWAHSLDRGYISDLKGSNLDLLAELNINGKKKSQKDNPSIIDSDSNVDIAGIFSHKQKSRWLTNESFSTRLSSRIYKHLYISTTVDWRSEVYLGQFISKKLQNMPQYTSDTALFIDNLDLNKLYYFNGFSTISQLDASGNNFIDIGELARFQNLHQLNLSNNPLKSLKGIENCHQLQELILNNVELSKMDYQNLIRLTRLNRIEVDRSELSKLETIRAQRPNLIIETHE